MPNPKFVPKSKIRNPKSKIRNPKSQIQNPKFAHKKLLHNAPKSKIPNPKSKIRNPKSKISRQNPKFGALGASHKEMLHNDAKSKIPKIRPKKFGFWILGRSTGCTTRQFSDGASGSEARIPPGPPLTASAKPTVSDTVREREQTGF